MRRAGWTVFGLLAIVLVTGCGGSSGPKLAKVTGVVTLDGKPFADAYVNFQPIGTAENPNPGTGSVGRTDDQGKFRLFTERHGEGAVIGPHRVRITIVPGKGTVVEETPNPLGTPDDAPGRGKGERDPIPLEWNENSKVEFEVKPGTNEATFNIVTKKDKSGKK